ncbi:hypothetical protein KKF32_02085 [Patescibacteria group bacterium]|nr:hypothetical protein [Patescibacteria group bacterium]
MEKISESPFEKKEKEPNKVAARYYFFRHDEPVYSDEVAKLMNSHGYEVEHYSGAEFIADQEVPEEQEGFHPSEKQLKKFKGRRRSETFEPRYEIEDRAKFEAVIKEPSSRENLQPLVGILEDKNVVPFIITGPRTRHGFSAQSINKSLKDQGIEIDQKSVIVTDMLTDMNKHWIYLTEIAEEKGLKNPWDAIRNPAYKQALEEKNIETMVDIEERIKHFLQVLDRLFKKHKTNDPLLSEKFPAVISVTSDYSQLTLLKALGIKEINGEPILKFKPDVGSYVEVELMENGTAKIYYQARDQQNPQLVGEVDDFYGKIKTNKV